MGLLVSRVRAILREEDGQAMAEYGLILTLVALATIAGFTLLGGNINSMTNGLAGRIVSPGGGN